MLNVVAAVYLLLFLPIGPKLVPFDSMGACEAAKAGIVSQLSTANRLGSDSDVDWARKVEERAKRATDALICVKSK